MRAPVPTVLKLLRGNPGRRPISDDEPQPEKGMPVMPLWLSVFPVAVREWNREGKILNELGVITVADEGILATRAYLAHLMQTLSWDVKREGTTVKTQFGVGPNPKVRQLQQAITEYTKVGVFLGLDPSSRTRLHVPKKDKKKDAFEEFESR